MTRLLPTFRSRLGLHLAILLEVLTFAQAAFAGGIVSAPTEANLRAAMEGGGTVTFACDGMIFLAITLAVTNNTVLDGSGHNIVLSGNGTVGVLSVRAGVQFTLRYLSIANGYAPTGAGLYNDGNTAIEYCTFSDNRAIMHSPTSPDVSGGGGIYNDGQLTINGCTFVSNLAYTADLVTWGALKLAGGAVLNAPAGFLNVTNCTFNGNAVTFASGHGSVGGGALYSGGVALNSGNTANVINCTFYGNSCFGDTSSSSPLGGAISGNCFLRGSILAYSAAGGNVAGWLVDGGYNVCSDASPLLTNATSLISTDPLIGPLADNGGPTLTMALLPGSPAIDACPTAATPAVDQRGVPRPYGPLADIGALEWNSPRPPTLRFDALTHHVLESASNVVITVTRLGTNQSASVDFSTRDLTAIAGTNYVATNGTLNFTASESNKTFTVTLLDDGQVKGDKAFAVVLTNPSDTAVLGTPSTATVAIAEGDTSLSFVSTNYMAFESSGLATIGVMRRGYVSNIVSVRFATADGTALAGTDYVATNGVLTFNAGETNKPFVVPLIRDFAVGSDKGLRLVLSNPTGGAFLTNPAAAGTTIVDDDCVVAFATNNYFVLELDTVATIAVTRSGSSTNYVSVSYNSSPGTAIPGTDYSPTSGTLNFSPGQTSAIFAVPKLNNPLLQSNVTINLSLANPSSAATLGPINTALLTVIHRPAGSGGVVTDFTEANLRAAISPGGTVTFAKDGAITLSQTISITKDTVLDGSGHTVTLRGGGAVRLFQVSTNVTFSIVGLTLADGRYLGTNGIDNTTQPGEDARGAGILNVGGIVSLTSCVLSNHVVQAGNAGQMSGTPTPGGSGFGGAICTLGGTLNLSNCVITGNQSIGGIGNYLANSYGSGGTGYGGAIYGIGASITLRNVNLSRNSSLGGKVIYAGGAVGGSGKGGAFFLTNCTLHAADSAITGNSATGMDNERNDAPGGMGGPAAGGAIYLTPGCAASLESLVFTGNTASNANQFKIYTPRSGQGGAIFNAGTLQCINSSFSSNSVAGSGGSFGAPGQGGGIFSTGFLTLVACTLNGNTALGGYGNIMSGAFSAPGGNGEGGGVWSCGSFFTTNSTFSFNRAVGNSPVYGYPGQPGSAIGAGIAIAGGSATIVNATVAANSAEGGIEIYTTGYGASAQQIVIVGDELGAALSNTNGAVTVVNSILASNTNARTVWGTIIDGGYNLCSDDTADFSAVGSLNNTDPLLVNLADNGGPTMTMALLPGSFARDAIPSGFPPTDQRGVARPIGSAADIGAFEAESQVTAPLILTPPYGGTYRYAASSMLTVNAVGTRPLSYQWFKDSNAVAGATSSFLSLNNLSATNAGTYFVIVSNLVGKAQSPGATLVVDQTPLMTLSPTGTVVSPAASVTFSSQADGPLLSYQWWHNGASIAGATNPTLTISRALLDAQGKYWVVASNYASSTTSAVAVLNFVWGGQVIAWGDNSQGQINVPGGLANVVSVAAGSGHSLALASAGTVSAWGFNYWGQCNVPNGLTNVVAVAAGAGHSLALRSDGTIVAWGLNTSGQRDVPTGMSNVIGIAAGFFFSLALKADGTIIGFGDNSSGQCVPPGGLSNVVAIAVGNNHSLGLKSDGTVVGWGDDSSGQTEMPVGLSNVVAIAAGGAGSLALKADGTVVAWGNLPAVPLGLSNVVGISAGSAHCLALKADGTIVAWGDNSSGQISVPAGASNVLAIAAGASSSTAVVGNGKPIFILSSSKPAMTSGRFSVSLATQSGRVYALEYKNTLSESSWTRLSLNAGNGTLRVLTDPNSLGLQRFYRISEY